MFERYFIRLILVQVLQNIKYLYNYLEIVLKYSKFKKNFNKML